LYENCYHQQQVSSARVLCHIQKVTVDRMVPRLLPKQKGPIIAMTCVVGISCGAVLYTHYSQVRDRNSMKAGVERDKERLRMIRRRQRQEQSQQQSSSIALSSPSPSSPLNKEA
jgi:PET assembly of cytochrome c oxidase, mitochondrial